MILGLIGGLIATESVSMLIEGSALAITTYYTAKNAKKTTTRKKKI